MSMKILNRLVLLSVAGVLASCNGGKDFSGASVPGCPAGAACKPNTKGSIIVQFQGPQVANLGYQCGSSIGRTKPTETTVSDSSGNDTTVPAYGAVCPSDATEINFFIGSVTYQGHNVSLGSYLLPQQLKKGVYQVTAADLLMPPSRVGIDVPSPDTTEPVINRVALLEALDTDGNPDDAVTLSDDAHVIADSQNALVPANPFDYTDYDQFKSVWQGYLDAVKARAPTTALFEPQVSNYQAHLRQGNNRSRAGLYVFSSSQECQFLSSTNTGCASDASSDKYSYTLTSLVLPDGTILAGGLDTRVISSSSGSTSVVNDFVTLKSHDVLDDRLALSGDAGAGVTLTGLGVVITTDGSGNTISPSGQPTDTDATITGRFLGQTLYNDKVVSADVGSDFSLDYPSTDYAITDSDKGLTNGTLLGGSVSNYLLRATKTGYVQANMDSTIMASVQGDYRIRLYRACIPGETGYDSECRNIPNPDQEITKNPNPSVAPSTNYGDFTQCDTFGQTNNGNVVCTTWSTVFGITKERIRHDTLDSNGLDTQGVGEFCLHIDNAGLVTTRDNGNCNATGAVHSIGMVTRTFTGSDDASLRSANVFMRLAPGAENASVTPHYNAEIQGRIDLTTTGDGCKRLLRLSDDNFKAGVRSAWVEGGYLPRQKIIADGPDGEPNDGSLPLYIRYALASGAVEMYQDNGSCGPIQP